MALKKKKRFVPQLYFLRETLVPLSSISVPLSIIAPHKTLRGPMPSKISQVARLVRVLNQKCLLITAFQNFPPQLHQHYTISGLLSGKSLFRAINALTHRITEHSTKPSFKETLKHNQSNSKAPSLASCLLQVQAPWPQLNALSPPSHSLLAWALQPPAMHSLPVGSELFRFQSNCSDLITHFQTA